MNEQQLQQTAVALTKALGYAENGGKPDPNHTRAGKTGELKSIFQFEPATWKAYAKEYLGNENAPVTPDNETAVVLREVSKELKSGKSVKQIASHWNSGDYDAYTGKFSDGSPSIGINKKYGVKFNVPAYANTVESYVQQFTGGEHQGTAHTAPQFPQTGNQVAQKLMTIMQSAKQSQAAKSGTLGQAASAMPNQQPAQS